MVKIDLSITVQQADYVSQPGVQVLWQLFTYMVSYVDFFVAFNCLPQLCGSLLPDKLLQWEKDVLLFLWMNADIHTKRSLSSHAHK